MNPKKWTVRLAASSIGLYLFKSIYNYFGHGVTSQALNTVWYWPWLMILFLFIVKQFQPDLLQTSNMKTSSRCFLLALFSLIICRILQGVFEIAGTSSSYLAGYYFAMAIFSVLGIVFLLLAIKERHRMNIHTK